MPQRFLRPGITNSERWNSVYWNAQSLFIRLLTLVDDFGRCDGRPPVILGQCFSVWNALHQKESCDLLQLEQMLQQLAASGLVSIYETDDKVVIQISQWQERIREGVKEKWPSNPNPKLQHVAASCSKLLPSSPPPPSSPRTLAQNQGPVEGDSIFNFQNTIGAEFGRIEGQRWSMDEERALVEVSKRSNLDAEWKLVKQFKASIPKDRIRFECVGTVKAILEHWTEILDKINTSKNHSDSNPFSSPEGTKAYVQTSGTFNL